MTDIAESGNTAFKKFKAIAPNHKKIFKSCNTFQSGTSYRYKIV